ncbi:hypothetical protein L208DRAFT_1408354 [Tricholoma matsutake]|nr:hypothetical protein L208DRAFT_1408354 [Tricholoma matsutake 945]
MCCTFTNPMHPQHERGYSRPNHFTCTYHKVQTTCFPSFDLSPKPQISEPISIAKIFLRPDDVENWSRFGSTAR